MLLGGVVACDADAARGAGVLEVLRALEGLEVQHLSGLFLMSYSC